MLKWTILFLLLSTTTYAAASLDPLGNGNIL